MKGALRKQGSTKHQARGPESGLALLGVLAGTALLSALALLLMASIKRSGNSVTAGTLELKRKLALELACASLERELLAELQAGSKPTSVGTEGELLQYPATALSAVPYRPAGLAPNLLRQSRRETSFYNTALSCVGAAVYPAAAQHPAEKSALAVSTETPALNFPGISAARWNAPALLPRPTAAGVHDRTPARSGTSLVGGKNATWIWTAPDWLVVQHHGGTARTWTPDLRCGNALNPSAESASFRYAFQIYDTGGLLDLNHAGYDPAELSPEDAARKGSTAFADLAQIGLCAETTQALVRWRNIPLEGIPSGPPHGNPLLNALLGPARGPYWLSVLNTPKTVSSERRFTSRKQLLKFLESLPSQPQGGSSVEASQYVTHFSRALEQPSHRHGAWDQPGADLAVPRIVSPAGGVADSLHPIGAAPLLPAKDLRVQMNLPYEMALGNYRGGNDAWGSFPERGAETEGPGLLQDAINPPLLEVRVTVPFTRRDGKPAEPGEPLLKSRFPLSRLAWVTHRGPSATLHTTDPLYNAEGTAEAIKACFGLEWTRDAGLAFQPTDAPGPPEEQLGYFFWKYDHSSPDSKVRPESIARLSSVAEAGREPDFFELLKAGILVGSLGKAAAKNHAGMEGWSHDPASFSQLRDKDPTNQILEIGANILDQSDADSFPTLIKIGTRNTAATGSETFVPTFTARGVENLPYLYRLHWRAVPNANDPPSRHAVAVTEITSSLSSFLEDGFHCGTTSLIAFPELWNPHLPPARPATSTLKLRMLAVAEDPEGPTGPDSQLRPLFPLLSTRWKTLLFGGALDDQHAHFSAWPGGAFAFSISTAAKSTKVFFHDRRFSSSYEFFGTTANADDHHSGRLATNGPAEPSSYLHWEGMPGGGSSTKHAVEGYAYWKLATDGFAPLSATAFPANAQPPPQWRGNSYSITSSTWGARGRPVWFAPADGRVSGSAIVEGPPSPDPAARPAPVLELRNSELTFALPLSQTSLFREPTALCRRGLPSGSDADFGPANFFNHAPYHGTLTGPDGEEWLGFSLGEVPSQFIAAQRLVSAPKTTVQGAPERVDSTGALSASGTLWRFFQVPVNLVVQRNWCLMTLRLQYQDPLSGKWITYDEKFAGMDGRMVPDQPPYQGQWNAVPVEGTTLRVSGWASPVTGLGGPAHPPLRRLPTLRLQLGQRSLAGCAGRLRGKGPSRSTASATGAGTKRPSHTKRNSPRAVAALGGAPALYGLSWTRFKAALEQDPSVLTNQYQSATAWWAVRSKVQPPSLNANDYGWISRLRKSSVRLGPQAAESQSPAGSHTFGRITAMTLAAQESTETGKWQYRADSFRPGWLSENTAPDPDDTERQAYADPDDVIRRATGARAAANGYYQSLDGLPLAQPNGTPNRSRPVVLDRPFRSVAELGYVFRGAPWKQLDFSCPETADAALLDLFCLAEPPAAREPLISGKVNLNTRQEPVLRALLAGALRDELDPAARIHSPEEIAAAARTVLERTSGTGLGRGPLTNMGELVGRILGRNLQLPGSGTLPNAFTAVHTPASSTSATLYTSVAPHTVTAPGRNPDTSHEQPVTWTFSGLSADLDGAFASASDQKIPRLRESVLRALSDCGQVRVWNLLIDVIVQTGHYPPLARNAAEFHVEGESRAWVHLAIDRLTGKILDRQVELVEE
jgi:hypothetical protein